MAYKESYAGRINRKLNKKLHVVEVAAGRQKADLVLKNATYVNVFCNQLSRGDIAVAEGLIAGMGGHYEGEVEVDMSGKLVLPGFVDAHIHLESSLVSPKEVAKAGLERSINQYFAALTNLRSVGVMGDERTYDYAIALRAVETQDFMTADFSRLPWELLDTVSRRIVNEVKGVNRILYDVTSKPPATVELE